MGRHVRRQLRLLTFVACLSSGTFPGLAQTSARAPLPPEAQAAIDKGVLAAKEQGYLLAIRYFEDAHKIAPHASEIYYNLGLAESKIPGRELRAVSWFGAYLTAAPNAPNASAVKGEIDRLEIRSQISLAQVIQSVQDKAREITTRARPPATDWWGDLGEVAVLWARSGDIAASMKVIDLIQDAQNKSRAQENVAEALAKAGDIAGAQATANRIDDKYRSGAIYEYLVLAAIADAQIRVGDMTGARTTLAVEKKTADLFPDDHAGYGSIAAAQVRAGDIAGAKVSLAAELRDIDLHPTYDRKGRRDSALATMVKIQLTTGDVPGALKTEKLIEGNDLGGSLVLENIAAFQLDAGDIPGAIRTSGLMQDPSPRDRVQEHITEAQVKAGNIAGALDAAVLIRGATDKSNALESIAEYQLKAGAIAGAQKTAGLMPDGYQRNHVWYQVANNQVKAGDIAGAEKTAGLIPDGVVYKGFALEEIAGAQAKAGDIDRAQKTADRIREPRHRSLAQTAIADAQSKRGDISGARGTLAAALKTADLIQSAEEKGAPQGAVAAAQAKVGDIAEALRTALAIQDAESRSTAQVAIAEAQLTRRDTARAQETLALADRSADLITVPYIRSMAQIAIAKAQSKAGDSAGAMKTLVHAQWSSDRIGNPEMEERQTKLIAAEAGAPPIQSAIATTAVSDWLDILDHDLSADPFPDLVGHLKSLPNSNDPQKVYAALRDTAAAIVFAQNKIENKLKQQARK